jgi:hypothetical protein
MVVGFALKIIWVGSKAFTRHQQAFTHKPQKFDGVANSPPAKQHQI